MVLRAHPLPGSAEQGPQIRVDTRAQLESDSPDESTVPLAEGQLLSQRKLLELMLIPRRQVVRVHLARAQHDAQAGAADRDLAHRLALGAVMNQQPHTTLGTSRAAVRAASTDLIASLRRELRPPRPTPAARVAAAGGAGMLLAL
ncbi:hypothetical protein [Streptomyces sp. NPDC089919]|uniref:hypothetical protein n=1 Tax=Streptomyces sp. NPDC089919 TaxID=3155188 RepID=UPI003428E3BB